MNSIWKCRQCKAEYDVSYKLPVKKNPSGIMQEVCEACGSALDLVVTAKQEGKSLALCLSEAMVGLQTMKDGQLYVLEICPACNGQRMVGGGNTPRVPCSICMRSEASGNPMGVVPVPVQPEPFEVQEIEQEGG